MSKCPKCGSTDLNVLHQEAGKYVTSSWEKGKGCPYPKFLSYSEYDFYYTVTVKKEHLIKKCKTCQYKWRENVIDGLVRNV